ncbi:hypothetical protein OO012_06035 [Rhodobacteraceae bacterium KMM 6894]|jgi:hypothetical protein|nr:hypothetical protein [Rhodobacteraceae bacterium KMM 6894]
MSKVIKSVLALGLVATFAACAQQAPQDDYVVVEPITVEPVSTGKYGGKY